MINTDVHRTHIHTHVVIVCVCVCVYTHTGTHLATHATTYRISSMRVCASVCVCCYSRCCCCTCTYAHPQSAPRDRALQKQLCFIFFLSQQRRRDNGRKEMTTATAHDRKRTERSEKRLKERTTERANEWATIARETRLPREFVPREVVPNERLFYVLSPILSLSLARMLADTKHLCM